MVWDVRWAASPPPPNLKKPLEEAHFMANCIGFGAGYLQKYNASTAKDRKQVRGGPPTCVWLRPSV